MKILENDQMPGRKVYTLCIDGRVHATRISRFIAFSVLMHGVARAFATRAMVVLHCLR